MKSRSLRHYWHKSRFYIISLAGIALVVGAIGALWLASIPLPDVNSFNERKVIQSSKVYDRKGELLYTLQEDARRTVIPSANISHYIKNATVAIEDPEFYEHVGIKPKAIARAIYENIKDLGYSQGGSTITQQVIKNALLTQVKSPIRKMKEWVLAVKLEQTMTKDEILAVYLNETGYGGNLYGVEEASKAYYGKQAKDVTLAEAAYLAALPQSPSRFSPYGTRKNELDARKNTVLDLMLEKKFITKEEHEKAKVEEVVFHPRKEGIQAPHFVFYIKDYLIDKYGEDRALNGGLDIYTTLDLELQKKVEEMTKRHALNNAKLYNASNASAVVIDATTGQILAMVGSRDYFDEEIDGKWNVSIGQRQPGSTFKPIVYTLAFSKGYTTDTVLFDVPTEFTPTCNPAQASIPISGRNPGGCYHPHNYDGKFRGPMTLRNALAQSINIPAVKLLYLVGINESIDFARRLGISTLDDNRGYGLSLVLGGAEVSLVEMTSAFGVFSQEGIKRPTVGIMEIKDRDGNIIEKYEDKSTRVIDAEPTRMLSSILSDNVARSAVFGPNTLRVPNRTVAVKTGTTNDFKDVWSIGYTPEIVVGVWGGNNDNKSISGALAGIVIVPLWKEIMTEVLKDKKDLAFNPPRPIDPNLKPIFRGQWRQGGASTQYVDSRTGEPVDERTPIQYRQPVTTNSAVHTILHWIDKTDIHGPPPEDPNKDPQYKNWEYAIANSQWGYVAPPPTASSTGVVMDEEDYERLQQMLEDLQEQQRRENRR